MDDDAGKTIRIQTMIPPPHPVVPSTADLAFQPVYVRKFMKDHIRLKIQKAPELPGARFNPTSYYVSSILLFQKRAVLFAEHSSCQMLIPFIFYKLAFEHPVIV